MVEFKFYKEEFWPVFIPIEEDKLFHYTVELDENFMLEYVETLKKFTKLLEEIVERYYKNI